jgi:hypothetical protein
LDEKADKNLRAFKQRLESTLAGCFRLLGVTESEIITKLFRRIQDKLNKGGTPRGKTGEEGLPRMEPLEGGR